MRTANGRASDFLSYHRRGRPPSPAVLCAATPPRHRSLATPVLLLLFVLSPDAPRVAVGRVDERGRALCLTFCKNPPPRSPPPPPPPLRPSHSLSLSPSPPPSPSSCSVSTLFFLLLSHLLRHHFLTLRCPVSPMVFCCTRSDVRRRYIALSRRRISNMMSARARARARAGTQSLSIFSFSFFSLSLPSFLPSFSYGRVAVLSRIPRGRAQPAQNRLLQDYVCRTTMMIRRVGTLLNSVAHTR